jgi:hypothetical protein
MFSDRVCCSCLLLVFVLFVSAFARSLVLLFLQSSSRFNSCSFFFSKLAGAANSVFLLFSLGRLSKKLALPMADEREKDADALASHSVS